MQFQVGNYFIIELSRKQYVNFILNFICLRRFLYSSLDSFLKFDFPAVYDYMEFNLQTEKDNIKAWIKDYELGRRGAMLLNSLIKKDFTNLN